MKSLFVKDAAREQYRVLVADDSPAIRGVFQSFPGAELIVQGIVTDRAALAHAMAKWPDIDAVLCSDQLSGTYGGAQALTELRERGALAHHTAFILMCGDARKSNLMANIEARPDGILLKPFAPSMLIAKLDAAVMARRTLAPLRELAAQQSWLELERLASELLDKGTRYQAAVDKFKLEASAQLADPASLRASYQLALAKRPNSPVLLEALARLAYGQAEYDNAAAALARLLLLQPANIQASDLMVDVLLANADLVGAQRQLQSTLRQSPDSVQRQRLLGHVALLNGDTLIAQRAYLGAMRKQAAAGGLDEVDVVNAVRALMLHGDNINAWQVVTESRKVLPDSLPLDILERLVEAVMCRTYDPFSKTQQRLTDAIALLGRPIVKDFGPLTLAAIEACLITVLVHRAYRMCRELVSTLVDVKLHSLQMQWAHKLQKWAIDTEGDELPHGMQNFHKFMR
jgi:CheY-like chemotaxis protein